MAKPKPKPVHPSLGVNQVNYDPVTHMRTEKRGIFELAVSKTEYSLKQFGRPLPDELGQADIMLKVAVNLVRVADFPLSDAQMTREEMLTWAGAIHARWGSLSLPALAANFILFMTAIIDDLRNRKKAQDDKFHQILAFAAAWHALHMEVFGGHALAYGKAQHAAGQTKGSQTTAQNGAMRATIIRTEIENLRQRVSDPTKLAKPAFVAGEIRSAANAAFAKEGLSASASKDAFERLVRRVMATK